MLGPGCPRVCGNLELRRCASEAGKKSISCRGVVLGAPWWDATPQHSPGPLGMDSARCLDHDGRGPIVVASALGHESIGVVVIVLVLLVWLGLIVRALLPVRSWRAAGGGGADPLPPNAGVRDPRRPKPNPVAGAAPLE